MPICRDSLKAAGLAGLLLGAAGAVAVPQGPQDRTFFEQEGNDSWSSSQTINAHLARAAASDDVLRFFISGKLQLDCVWDIQPKCALRAFAKPQPARDLAGHVIPGQFFEAVIGSSNVGFLAGVAPLEDRTVRIAVAALMDAFDGTVNGLSQNGLHQQIGEVTVQVRYNRPGGGEAPNGVDASYVFRFQSGGDALRWSFIVPADVPTVDVLCLDDTGVVGVCYDVDFYRLIGLQPGQPYCITVVGGMDEFCLPTDTVLGWYDKQGYLIGGANGFSDDAHNPPYSEICVYADAHGTIWFAVSGKRDENFNGLLDVTESAFASLLQQLSIRDGLNFTFTPGASVNDLTIGDVIRYPREIWSDAFYAAYFSPGVPPEARFDHGVCGSYCIQVTDALHMPGSHGGTGGQLGRRDADINGDGFVNATDLAFLLSYWGTASQ